MVFAVVGGEGQGEEKGRAAGLTGGKKGAF